jgi:Dolichyl-phosphate-mannose-protein mannosyltransferase
MKRSLYIAWSILLGCFLIVRLPFLLNYPLVGFYPDSSSYYSVFQQVRNLEWPIFEVRTPGFPFFWFWADLFSTKAIHVILYQFLYSLASSAFLVYSFWRFYPQKAIGAGLLLGMFVSTPLFIEHDTALLTESVFVSSLMTLFGLLLHALHDSKTKWWIGVSVAMFAVVMVRPTGLFLVITYLLIAGYLFWNKVAVKQLIAFAVPFPLLMGLYLGYNLLISNFLGVTLHGQNADILGPITTIIQPKPHYTPEANKELEVMRKNIHPIFTQVALNSSDTDSLFMTFANTFLQGLHYGGRLQGAYTEQNPKLSRQEAMLKAYADMQQIYKEQNQPSVRRKFFYSNFYYFFFKKFFVWENLDQLYQTRYQELILNMKPETLSEESKKYYREFAKADARNRMDMQIVQTPQGGNLVFKPTFFHKLSLNYWKLQNAILGSPTVIFLLGLLLMIGVIGSGIGLIYTKFRNPSLFFVFLLTTAALGQGIIVSWVQVASLRYSYTLEFANYLWLLFIPLLISTFRPKKTIPLTSKESVSVKQENPKKSKKKK